MIILTETSEWTSNNAPMTKNNIIGSKRVEYKAMKGGGNYSNQTSINDRGRDAATIRIIPWVIIEVRPRALGQILHPQEDHK